jgi:hypothetical protein
MRRGATVSETAPVRLLADAMLGRLARWLRLIGYDTVYTASLTDHQIAARARAEERIVLTRDRALTQRRGIRCLFVDSQVLEEQLDQVVTALGPPRTDVARCSKCNTPLVPVTRSQVQSEVPSYVFETHDQFHRCTKCNQIYWPGSHWDNVQHVVAHIARERKETDER